MAEGHTLVEVVIDVELLWACQRGAALARQTATTCVGSACGPGAGATGTCRRSVSRWSHAGGIPSEREAPTAGPWRARRVDGVTVFGRQFLATIRIQLRHGRQVHLR